MAKFEKVSKFAEVDINLPARKTADSAGYDMEVAEDVVIPSFYAHYAKMCDEYGPFAIFNLNDLAAITKRLGTKPTLVSTGMKCQLDKDTFLQLSVRSSSPLKYWLMMANGVGIIDADYYNNPNNEGEIFLQIYNLSPFNIQIKKGEAIGQGVILPYTTVEDDISAGERTGGFGSTNG